MVSREVDPALDLRSEVAKEGTNCEEDVAVGNVWSETRLKRRVQRTFMRVATFAGESMSALRTFGHLSANSRGKG